MYLSLAALVLSVCAAICAFIAICLIPTEEQRRREVVDVLAELKRARGDLK